MADTYTLIVNAQDQASDDLDQVADEARRMGLEVEEAGEQMEDASEKSSIFADVLSADLVSEGLQRVADFASELPRQLANMTAEFAEQTAAIERNAQAANVTTERYQELAFGFRRVGLDGQALQETLGTLSERAFDARDGAQGMADDFRSIGISIDDLQGRGPAELFGMVAEGIGAAETETQAYKGATSLLGDEIARGLVPRLRENADLFEDLGDRAAETGNQLSDETIQKAEQAAEKLKSMRSSVSGLGKAMAAELLPALKESTSLLADFAVVASDAVQQIGDIRQTQTGQALEAAGHVTLFTTTFGLSAAAMGASELVSGQAEQIRQRRREQGGGGEAPDLVGPGDVSGGQLPAGLRGMKFEGDALSRALRGEETEFQKKVRRRREKAAKRSEERRKRADERFKERMEQIRESFRDSMEEIRSFAEGATRRDMIRNQMRVERRQERSDINILDPMAGEERITPVEDTRRRIERRNRMRRDAAIRGAGAGLRRGARGASQLVRMQEQGAEAIAVHNQAVSTQLQLYGELGGTVGNLTGSIAELADQNFRFADAQEQTLAASQALSQVGGVAAQFVEGTKKRAGIKAAFETAAAAATLAGYLATGGQAGNLLAASIKHGTAAALFGAIATGAISGSGGGGAGAGAGGAGGGAGAATGGVGAQRIDPEKEREASAQAFADALERERGQQTRTVNVEISGTHIGNTTPDIERAVRKAVDGDRERTSRTPGARRAA